MAAANTLDPKDKQLFGHPIGLTFLFLTEMWERFSFYGMRALLTLYMVNFLFIQPDVGQRVLGFTALKGMFPGLGVQPLASTVYGLYTGLVYLTPFFGGMLADRVLGQRKTVIIGALLMAVGHFLMAIESLFLLALIFLILGNGAFKPNISTQVGTLYPHGDPRRDRAFSIFYVGINVGAFFSPLICGTLGQVVGWHWGFGAAGVGMILGLIIYLAGQKYLAEDNLTVTRQQSVEKAKEPLTRAEKSRIAGLLALCFCTIFFWMTYEQQGNTLQLWVDKYTDLRLMPNPNARPVQVDEKVGEKGVKLSAGEILAHAGPQFYAIRGDLIDKYNQAKPRRDQLVAVQGQIDWLILTILPRNNKGEPINDKTADGQVPGIGVLRAAKDDLTPVIEKEDKQIHSLMGKAIMPSTWYQSFNPFLIFTMTPLVTWFWGRQAKKGKTQSSVAKMAIGVGCVGVSFLIMILAATLVGTEFKTNLIWLFGSTVIITLGELYVSPVGLSLVTKLAPVRMVSMLMGVWFLATFLGNNAAGYIGRFFEIWPKQTFFAVLAAIALIIGLVIAMLYKPISKAIGGGEAASDL